MVWSLLRPAILPHHSVLFSAAVDFVSSPTDDNLKCPIDAMFRVFKLYDVAIVQCEEYCAGIADCKYFTMQNETGGFCIGCRIAPSDWYGGAKTYVRVGGRFASTAR